MLLVKNFNKDSSMSLPYDNGCILLGNDYNNKKMIINAIIKYFSGKKLNQEEHEYLDGNDIEIYINDRKVQSKEYIPIIISPEIDISNEIQLSKSSFSRRILSKLLKKVLEYDPKLEFINDLIEELLQSEYSKDVNDFFDLLNNNEENNEIKIGYEIEKLTLVDFLDTLLKMKIYKGNSILPVNYTSYIDSLRIYIKIIDYMINYIEESKRFIIICDHLENKLNDIETKEIYSEVKRLQLNSRVDVIIVSSNGKNISISAGNIETVSILNKNKQLKIYDIEHLLKEVEINYYKDIQPYQLEDGIYDVIKNHSDLICKKNKDENYYNISRMEEEIIKILDEY